MQSSHQVESARADSATGPCGLVSDSRRASGCRRTDPGTQEGPARLPDEATEAAAAVDVTALHAGVQSVARGQGQLQCQLSEASRGVEGSPAVSDAIRAADKKA